MSVNWWMDKWNVIHSYNGIFWSHKKEWNLINLIYTVARMNLRNIMLSKSVTKDYALYDYVCGMGWEQESLPWAKGK